MDISVKVNLEAPDLAKAITSLATAITTAWGPEVPVPSLARPEISVSPVTQPMTPPAAVPITPQIPQVEQLTIQTPAPTPPPTPLTTVPTTPQTYTMEQLAVAATQLVDAGRRMELVTLLNSFGVQALTALPKEQYGAFATKLREMGAKL